MSDHPTLMFLFVLANVCIAAGYFFLAAFIVPSLNITMRRTKIGGAGFLALCAMTHLGMAFDGLFHSGMTMGQMATAWYVQAVHIPQAICVWLFVTGLYIEVGERPLFTPRKRDSD